MKRNRPGYCIARLLKGNAPAWTDAGGDPAKHVDRVRNPEENAPPDRRIKMTIQSGGGDVGLLKGHIRQSSPAGPETRSFHRGRVDVDTHDFAAGADNLGDEPCNIARSAAHIEHTHSG